MKRRIASTVWFQRLLFFSAGLLAILVLSLPAGLDADSWPTPDLLFATCACWVIRKPNASPFYLVAALGLLADVLLGRHVGLDAFLLMCGTEIMRQNIRSLREYPLVYELLWFAGVFALALLVQIALLAITFAPNISMIDLVRYFAATLISYPVIVAVLHWGLRVRHSKENASAFGLKGPA